MKYIILFFVSLLLLSCDSESTELKYYKSKFYPIKNEKSVWSKDAFFINSPAFFHLESRLCTESDYYYGEFEPIDINNTLICLDRDIIMTNDTVRKFTNLLDVKLAEIKESNAKENGGFDRGSYIITINKNKAIDLKTNNGYYTVYIKAITENKYFVNDSTFICVE